MSNEQFLDDMKRKNWVSNQWKESPDDLDRLIWFIHQLSPWNLWKAKQAIRDFMKENR